MPLAQFELFKHYGFQSGRDTNKFETFEQCARGTNGIYYITEGTNAYISVTVTKTEDLGSHTMFIGEITDMEVLSNVPSVTYNKYHLCPWHTAQRLQTYWYLFLIGSQNV